MILPTELKPKFPIDLHHLTNSNNNNKTKKANNNNSNKMKISSAIILISLTFTPASAQLRGVDKTSQRALISEFIYDVPDMSTEEIADVMDWIKKEVTMVRNPFCWKESYGRGAGTFPGRVADCPSGYTNDGLTCRRPTDDIYAPSKLASCPSGWRNYGLTCTEKLGTGGCSVWKPWKCDTFSIHAEPQRMSCPAGYFLNRITTRCHKNCPSGYTNTGETCHRPLIIKGVDSMICKSSETKIGARCYPKGGNLGSCFNDEENDAGLCYEKCRSGYVSARHSSEQLNDTKGRQSNPFFSMMCLQDGVGPVCWQTCDDSQVDCGAGCAKSSGQCALAVANQVIAPVIVAANIVTLGLADATADAVKAGTTVAVGGKQVAYTSSLGKYALQTLNKLQSINKTGQAGATITQRIVSARLGTTLSTVVTTLKVDSLTMRAKDAYDSEFTNNFAQQTSEDIERELDSHFHPITARFLKIKWGEIALMELAEANGWAVASLGLSTASLADPTGIVALVDAYAKPKCGENVPFPCTSADISPACN